MKFLANKKRTINIYMIRMHICTKIANFQKCFFKKKNVGPLKNIFLKLNVILKRNYLEKNTANCHYRNEFNLNIGYKIRHVGP